MKIFKYLFFVTFFGLLTACELDPEDLVTAEAQEGAQLNLTGSGTLAGSIDPTVPIAESRVDITEAVVDYNVNVFSNVEAVEELVVSKTYKGQTVEVTRANAADGVTFQHTSLSEILAGFEGVTPADLRIGDQVVYFTELVMKDGRVLLDNTGLLGVNVSCAADLTGTYLVTNSWCSPSFEIEITRNPDGSYNLPVADGGGLSRCTANTGLANSGTIVEQCGEILPSTALDYGTDGGYGIGDVVEGSWDAENGILTMKHVQGFTPNWPAEWTSTYTRQ